MTDVKVLVRAVDPLVSTAVSSHLDSRPDVEVAVGSDSPVDVVVLITERMTAEVISTLRRGKAFLDAAVVLIIDEISRTDLLTAVECGVVAVLPREAATCERIEDAVTTAATGGGMLPTNILGHLLKHIEHIQRDVLLPHGLHTSGLIPREIDVLRLLSEGLTTAEIATRLCFSERAVKRIISDLTSRLGLRNRPHAVAYALRKGVI
ncbi:DNA-binding NarL/FixJ family response regulator [Kibdelosporangium banguiense]|uniref:DNA-binding NarL/FixJ family response regulator n=1 Tax=Kibdelosporangium banguiense TaxID=1365924 RepID=A0ABS4U310_9PSEU|nr:response regulator transcription factor [Kibdelosporangium banguiense]MBP2330575.1 DNA-binding NarL/FixJ family response regulator [Kibdelosporangium banguiense]